MRTVDVFQAVDLKAAERRVDCCFEPKTADRPLYFAEIFFYKKENAYPNVFAKLFMKLEQTPTHPWRVAMVFERRSLEPADLSAYTPLLESGWVHRIYLDEVQETSQSGFGLCILKLASTPKTETINQTQRLVQRVTNEVRSASARNKLLELIEFIAISKLAHLIREEIRAMLRLEDYKKSRFYKEIREELREEFKEELAEKLLRQGIAVETIAETLEMDVDVVQRLLKKKTKK